jgi:pantoate--beta-alanine ligase
MQIFKEIAPLRLHLQHKRNEGLSVGIVPTMGALHEGHISLIQSSKRATGVTVCTLYVNPTQFNNASDLDKYPRTIERDVAMLEAAECDVLFAPETTEMYQRPGIIKFDFGDLDKVLEGKFRPGHFSGVATVVSKLFNIIEPTDAFFGQKDYQQLQVIKRLVEELKFNIRVHGIPTIREASGLAMSSRNMRLTEEQRKKALVLSRSLLESRERLLSGARWNDVQKEVIENINSIPELKMEYFELVHRDDLTRHDIDPSMGVILTACFVGDVRLIDNVVVSSQ